jgi:hypothetical protein
MIGQMPRSTRVERSSEGNTSRGAMWGWFFSSLALAAPPPCAQALISSNESVDLSASAQASDATAVAEPFSIKLGRISKVSNYIPRLSPAMLGSIALVICFVILRLWRLSAASLDGDEIFSLLLARKGWHNLLVGAFYDATHPPLFYLLLKVWHSIAGESLFWLRLFPVIVSSLSLFPFFLLCQTMNIRPMARNLALCIAAAHPYALFYAQHLRMYCLLTLGGLLSTWCFYSYLKGPSKWRLIVLAGVNLVLIYTHYFGLLIIGLEFVFLVGQRFPWRAFAVAMLLVTMLFSPWGLVAGKLLYAGALHEKLGWVSKPTLNDFSWFFVDLTGCIALPRYRVQAASLVLIVLALLRYLYRRQQGVGIEWLTFLAVAPEILTFVVSPWLPLWGDRHLVFTIWPFLIVLADSLCRLPSKAVFGVIVLTAFWIPFALQSYRDDDRKLPWNTLTIALMDHEHSNWAHIPIYSLDRDTHFPLWFYVDCLKNNKLGPFGNYLGSRGDIPALATKAARFEVAKVTQTEALRGQYFWLAYSDPPWKQGLNPEKILKNRRCQRGDPISARDASHSVTLVPVQCQEP